MVLAPVADGGVIILFFFQLDKGVDNLGLTGRIRVETFPGRGCHVATNVLATNAQTADVFGELAEDKCVARIKSQCDSRKLSRTCLRSSSRTISTISIRTT